MKIAGHTLAILPLIAPVFAAASEICLTQLGLKSVKSVPTYTSTTTAAAPTTTVFVYKTSTHYLGAWYTVTTTKTAVVT